MERRKRKQRSRLKAAGLSRLIIGAVLAALLATFAAVLPGCGADNTASTATTKSEAPTGPATPSGVAKETAPDFAGATLEGVEVSLSEYRGKPLLLAFMASW